jgi:hypothetical protein
VLVAGGIGFDKGPLPVLTPVPLVAVPPIPVPVFDFWLLAAPSVSLVPCARLPALLPSTSNVASRQDVFTVVIASTSRTRFSRHLPNGTRLIIIHMKSLTKINGANHASGYKSVAKFAQRASR